MSSPLHLRVSWGFWLLWSIATFAGTFLWFVTRAVLNLGFFTMAWLVVDVVTIPLALFFMGLFVCFAQWLTLRRYVPQASHWVWLSIGGWIVGLPLTMYAIGSVYLPVTNEGGWAISGIIVGTAQWLFLRSRVKNAGWWILVSAISWCLGMILLNTEFLGGWAGIIFQSVVTGFFMMLLLRHPNSPGDFIAGLHNSTC